MKQMIFTASAAHSSRLDSQPSLFFTRRPAVTLYVTVYYILTSSTVVNGELGDHLAQNTTPTDCAMMKSKCLNGGTCVMYNNTFASCMCGRPYYGERCEKGKPIWFYIFGGLAAGVAVALAGCVILLVRVEEQRVEEQNVEKPQLPTDLAADEPSDEHLELD